MKTKNKVGAIHGRTTRASDNAVYLCALLFQVFVSQSSRAARSCLTLIVPLVILGSALTTPSQRTSNNARTKTVASLTITTEPHAIVWIDDIRRGVTDASGKLILTKISPGRHMLRVRANGFRELSRPLLSSGSLALKLVRTTDQAELLFQQAEETREKANDDTGKEKAADLYRQALRVRPAFPAAHVGLARVLTSPNRYQEALAEIDAARVSRPIYPEASAVEGRIHREAGFMQEAMKSFRRAIREGRGFQPEAHVGLGLVLEEKGDYAEAAAEFRTAIEQLSDSEPVIYQLLGAAYDHAQKYKEAVAAYEKYLELAPNGSYAPAIRSMIEQLRRQAAGEEIIP